MIYSMQTSISKLHKARQMDAQMKANIISKNALETQVAIFHKLKKGGKKSFLHEEKSL